MAVLGKTGAGKSSAMRVIAEHKLKHKRRTAIIDPKGDWWGLKASADGKGPGFPIICFGNFKEPRATDIPINSQSGKEVAELIATGNRPCIIGFRGWMPAEMTRFWLQFAPTLFNLNVGQLDVLIDEIQNLAPKGKIMDPDSGKCLHWTNRLMAEGRGLGLTFTIASQRPQKVHNDTLDCCETLVAMRVAHPAARQALKDWIDGNGDPSKGKEVLATLAQLKRGEAYVWSPENGFGPDRVQFPMFETFDSFAAPELQKKVSDAGWSEVDLDQVKQKLAAVIAEAKANDPKELKMEIARLRQELSKKPTPAAPIVDSRLIQKAVKEAEAPLLKQIEMLKQKATRAGQRLAESSAMLSEIAGASATSKMDELTASFAKAIEDGAKKISRGEIQRSEARFHQIADRVKSHSAGDIKLGKAERCILTVLAQSGKCTKEKVAVTSGYAVSGGGFGNALSKLRTNGLVAGDSLLEITQPGLDQLGDFEPLPYGRALLAYWKSKLGHAEREILRVLDEDGGGLPREEIAARTLSAKGGPYEASGGGFGNAISKLRTLELIAGSQLITLCQDLREGMAA